MPITENDKWKQQDQIQRYMRRLLEAPTTTFCEDNGLLRKGVGGSEEEAWPDPNENVHKVGCGGEGSLSKILFQHCFLLVSWNHFSDVSAPKKRERAV